MKFRRVIIVAALAFCGLCPAPATAQVTRLPPVDSTAEQPAASARPFFSLADASSPPYPTNIFPPPVIDAQETPQAMAPSGAKDGVLQRLAFTATYLPRFDQADGQDNLDIALSMTLGFPFPTTQSPLLVTPAFESHFWDGPDGLDLPSVVYDAYVEFRWLSKLGERWGVDLSITPGLHTDFEASDGEALRIKAQTVAAFDWTPQAKVVFGVAYLDRNDVPFLPIGGLIWTPNEDTRWDLVFPRPKFARRVYCDGCVENWTYIAGELGGDQWAIERTGGVDDVVTTRDYRVMIGIERKVTGGLNSFFEFGYVFGREIEFDSATPDFKPADTLLFRTSVAY